MVRHTINSLAQVSAIAATIVAISLSATAHAADTSTADVTALMGSGSLRFSDTLIHTLQTAPTVMIAPIAASGDGTGMVAAPVTSLSGTFDTPRTTPQIIEHLSMDLSTDTLFGYVESGAVVSMQPTNLSLSPVPVPSATTPPSLSFADFPELDLSRMPQYGSLVGHLKDPPFVVWQSANDTMLSAIAMDVSPVPEASNVALMALGLVGMGLLNLRRNR